MKKAIALVLFAGVTLSAAFAETPDLTALEASLEAAEQTFARSATERDRAGFESFMTEETVFSTPHGDLRGPAAVLEQWAGFFAPGGPTIGWQPARVSVVADGNLGLTTGPFWIETKDADGKPVKFVGTFFSVWRRNADGEWKILLDTGTEAEPEAPSPEATTD